MTPPGSLSLKDAAALCGVSVRTLQRRREDLLRAGATQGPNGWCITRRVLEDVGLLSPDMSGDIGGQTRDSSSSHVARDLAVAEAKIELLERERAELLNRAESAERTAREATAAAAALAITLKQLEASHISSEIANAEAPEEPVMRTSTERFESGIARRWKRFRSGFSR